MDTPALGRSAAAGLVMAATGVLGCAAAGLSLLDELPDVVSESALCAGGTFFFREALSPKRALTELAGRRHDAAVAILAACALMSLARVQFMGAVSLGRVLALLVVMTASLKGGSFAGAAAGTAFGLAMDASAGTAGLYTMAWAFSALCAASSRASGGWRSCRPSWYQTRWRSTYRGSSS